MIKITDMANAVVQWMFEYHCHLEAWRAVVGHSSTLSLEKKGTVCYYVRATVRTRHGTTDWFKMRKGV